MQIEIEEMITVTTSVKNKVSSIHVYVKLENSHNEGLCIGIHLYFQICQNQSEISTC